MRRAGAVVAGVAIVGLAGFGLLQDGDGCTGAGCGGAPTVTVPETTTTVPPSVEASLHEVSELLDGIDAQIPGATAAEERDVSG